MDKSEAIRLCRAYFSECIEFEECDNPPKGLWNFNSSDEYLFSVSFPERSAYVGSSAYISVSKTTGFVRFFSYVGE